MLGLYTMIADLRNLSEETEETFYLLITFSDNLVTVCEPPVGAEVREYGSSRTNGWNVGKL